MKIVLFGMKHSGKSTLGRELARFWSCPFFDVDTLIENAFKTEECRKMTVREILAHYGEVGFEKREERTVYDLHRRLEVEQSNSPYVVALGGRTPLNRKLSAVLKKMGINIFLRVDAHQMWERILKTGIPSFLKSSDPEEEFMTLYRQSKPYYETQADLTVSLDNLSIRESIQKIIHVIKENAGVGK